MTMLCCSVPSQTPALRRVIVHNLLRVVSIGGSDSYQHCKTGIHFRP